MKIQHVRATIYLFIVTSLLSSIAIAQTFPLQVDGKITKYWADVSDVELELNTSGPCGSIYYRISRSNANFEQISALMMTQAHQVEQ